jgi:hypothetical protein
MCDAMGIIRNTSNGEDSYFFVNEHRLQQFFFYSSAMLVPYVYKPLPLQSHFCTAPAARRLASSRITIFGAVFPVFIAVYISVNELSNCPHSNQR